MLEILILIHKAALFDMAFFFYKWEMVFFFLLFILCRFYDVFILNRKG